MDNRLTAKVKNKYDAMRAERQAEKLRLQNELYDAVPQLREIEDEIRKCGIRYNRLALDGEIKPEEASLCLDADIQKLTEKKRQLLKENGYPEDYPNLAPSCIKCSDTGWINGKRCSCFINEIAKLSFEMSNIGPDCHENWDNFNEELYDDAIDEEKYGIKISPRSNIRKIKERCMRFTENIDDPDERNLLFYGHVGTGKTFVARCVATQLLSKGRTVLYQSAPDLFEAIGRYKVKAYKEGQFDDPGYSFIYGAEVLIIDDLGTETDTPARYAELLNILNSREEKNRKSACKTIIATNVSLKNLYENYTERVASRIIGNFDRLIFAGTDLRISKAL